jgi:hypothetical protein
MNKADIVRRALEAGVMLSPEALEKMDGSNIDQVLAEAKHSLVHGSQQPGKRGPEVSVKSARPKAKAKPKDFAEFYGQKYKAIKQMLLKRAKAVSINKAQDLNSEVSVIGMVKEMTASGAVLEDQTGEIEVVGDTGAKEGDVLVVRGVVREKKIMLSEAVWPDVPFARQVGRIHNTSLLLTAKGEKDADIIFSTEGAEGATHVSESPSWLTVTNNGSSLTVLAYRTEAKELKDAVMWLKKRHLPNGSVSGPKNMFIIDPVPEILWLIGPPAGKDIYKGVLIISCGEGSAKVNLETLEAELR